MEQHIIYVGLDVHKDTIAVALAEAGKRAEVRPPSARLGASRMLTLIIWEGTAQPGLCSSQVLTPARERAVPEKLTTVSF
jgi:hypothetical protein